MQGRHGKQLALAKLEGWGKDDLPLHPDFLDDDIDDYDDDGDEHGDDELYYKTKKEDGNVNNNNNNDDDDDEEEEEGYEAPLSLYHPNGSVRWKASERAMFRAGAPAGGLFAIIELAGTQFKVTTDDVLIVNRLRPVSRYAVGTIHTWTDPYVLLVGSSHATYVGMPYVSGGASVQVLVEEVTKDAKVTVFQHRRRQGGSKRKNGFRRDVTMLRILDITLPKQDSRTQYYRPRPVPSVRPEKEGSAASFTKAMAISMAPKQ